MKHERFIKCVIAHSLEWEEFEERAVDRVTAIGLSEQHNDLGDAMLRVDALDPVALRKVILLTTRRLNSKMNVSFGFGRRLAIAAMHEYMRANCIHCGGKGKIFQEGRHDSFHSDETSRIITECSHCNGTGLHRYSNADRRALIGGPYKEAAYEEALSFIRDAVVTILARSNKRLEDD